MVRTRDSKTPLSFPLPWGSSSGPVASLDEAAVVGADGVTEASEEARIGTDQVDAFKAVQVKLALPQAASDREVVAEKIDGLGCFHDLRLTVADAELVLPDFQVGRLGEDGAEGGSLPYLPRHIVVAHDEDDSSRLLFDDGKKPLDLLRVKVFQLGVEFDLNVIGEISSVNDPIRLEPP